MKKTVVVHCKKEPFDEYIGRPTRDFPAGSIWGNPFVIGRDGSRADVLRLHREWFPKQEHLMARLEELRGKRIGCWCHESSDPDGPECHGDFYVELLEGPQKPKQPEQFNLF